jgi:hypothetical protein
MTTYNAAAVANAAIAHRKGISLQTGRSLRDNPIAILEGATGAPANFYAWNPYNVATVGDGTTGLFYDHAVTGNVSTVETPDFVDGYAYRIRYEALKHDSFSDQTLQTNLYRETNAAYVGAVDTGFLLPQTTILTGYITTDRPRVAALVHGLIWQSFLSTSFAYAGVAARAMSSQKVLRARVGFSGGNIEAGRLYLERQRVL